MKQHGLATRLAAVAAAVTLTACGPMERLPVTAAHAVTGPKSPVVAQPFDILNFKAYDSVNASIWEYEATCAAEQGYSTTTSPRYDSGSGILQTPSKMGDATEEAARRNGLHDGPINPSGGSPPTRLSQTAQDSLAACLKRAEDKLGPAALNTTAQFIQLMNNMSSDFYDAFNPFEFRIFVEVNKCAAAAGWKPVDEVSLNDPTLSPPKVFGVQTAQLESGDEGDKYTPLPQEVDLALALVKCRVDFNVVDRMMAEAIKLETPIVAKYESQIREINNVLADLAVVASKSLA